MNNLRSVQSQDMSWTGECGSCEHGQNTNGYSPHADQNTVEEPSGIFGVPLGVSIRYANVAISLTNEDGESFIYGYVPIVVAKCGIFLKEKGKQHRRQSLLEGMMLTPSL